MADSRRAAAFAYGLYRRRLDFAYHGYLRRDPMSQLHLRIGRDNPYAVYERLRRDGTLVPTRLGNWVTTSHRVCNAVLRDRRFGVRSAEFMSSRGLRSVTTQNTVQRSSADIAHGK